MLSSSVFGFIIPGHILNRKAENIDEKKPRTVCKITKVGINAFEEYVKALKGYIGE